jgi:hypothetical protein
MKRLAIAALAVASIACCVLVGVSAQEKAEPKANDLVKVTRAVWLEIEDALRNFDKRPPDDQYYTWSLRLAEAEHSAASNATDKQTALAAHAERMKALEERVKASYDAGTIPKVELLAATYYRMNADEWMKRGR